MIDLNKPSQGATGWATSVNQNFSQLETSVLVFPGLCQGRLTIDDSNKAPLPDSDLTGKTTLYLVPFLGNAVAVHDGSSSWSYLAIPDSGVSLAVSAFPSGGSASTLYDIFAYDDGGALALEALAWTSSGYGTSARATTLARIHGALVKSGDSTRAFIGTVYLNSSTQLEDSLLNRHVANHHNRRARELRVASSTWVETTTSTWLEMKSSGSHTLSFVSVGDVGTASGGERVWANAAIRATLNSWWTSIDLNGSSIVPMSTQNGNTLVDTSNIHGVGSPVPGTNRLIGKFYNQTGGSATVNNSHVLALVQQ